MELVTQMGRRKKPLSASETKRIRGATIELEPDVERKVAVVAAALGVSKPQWVNQRLRDLLAEEVPRVLKAMGLSKDD